MHDLQCQAESDLSALTTAALADVRIMSDLFPHMKEARFRSDNTQSHALSFPAYMFTFHFSGKNSELGPFHHVVWMQPSLLRNHRQQKKWLTNPNGRLTTPLWAWCSSAPGVFLCRFYTPSFHPRRNLYICTHKQCDVWWPALCSLSDFHVICSLTLPDRPSLIRWLIAFRWPSWLFLFFWFYTEKVVLYMGLKKKCPRCGQSMRCPHPSSLLYLSLPLPSQWSQFSLSLVPVPLHTQQSFCRHTQAQNINVQILLVNPRSNALCVVLSRCLICCE